MREVIVNKLIIASTKMDSMRPWLEVLSSQYTVTSIDNIEMIFSEEKFAHDKYLLVLDAGLIDKIYQLPLLCKLIDKVIIIGENFTPSQQIQFIYEGACGYSDSLIEKSLIKRTIEGVLNDEIWLKRQYIPQMLKGAVARQSFSENQQALDNKIFAKISILTQREIEIVEHVYKGEDNVSIAEQLNISCSTVKAHVSAIFRKLNVPDRFKLVVFLKDLQVGQLASYNNH